jgi:hypothetical protein
MRILPLPVGLTGKCPEATEQYLQVEDVGGGPLHKNTTSCALHMMCRDAHPTHTLRASKPMSPLVGPDRGLMAISEDRPR